MTTEIDTTNYCCVSASEISHLNIGPRVVVLAPRTVFTTDEAMMFAAWLVALAEHDASITFADALAAVKAT